MRLPWTTRTRRLLFVALLLVVLTFPLVASLVTRARIDREGVDVTATVTGAASKGDSYRVAFRLPEEIDPDQENYSAEVDRPSYDKAAATKKITVRVLEDRPEAHRVDGQVDSVAPHVFMGLTVAFVLAVGLWWARGGRRRPTVRILAQSGLEPAGADEAGSLARTPGSDFYEAVGTVLSADDAEVVVDVGERQVVVLLGGHPNPVGIGSPVRARGVIVG